MTTPSEAIFKQVYQSHLKHLKLKGLQPKTIDAYARAMRHVGVYILAIKSTTCPNPS